VTLDLNHYWTSVLFALFSSIILGIVTKQTDRERLRYGAYCFGCFMAALFGIGWVMHFLHG
jgi:dolichyl-phosphate-mannose--protein O-mannosyl transferase